MRELLIVLQLARIIAGEAPGCSMEAKLAVAKVADNRVTQEVVREWRDGWYGDRDPETIDVVVAMLRNTMPDPTGGAVNLIGPHDKAKMPWLETMEMSGRWVCPGTFLEAYRMSRKSTGGAIQKPPIKPYGSASQGSAHPRNFKPSEQFGGYVE